MFVYRIIPCPLFTDRISSGDNAVASVRLSVCPSICFHCLSFEPTDLCPWPFECVWVMTTAVLDQEVKVNPNPTLMRLVWPRSFIEDSFIVAGYYTLRTLPRLGGSSVEGPAKDIQQW